MDPADVAGEAFRKKIKTHESPGFVSTQEGIKRMRRGMYAFQVTASPQCTSVLHSS